MDDDFLFFHVFSLMTLRLMIGDKSLNVVAPPSNSADVIFGLCRHMALTDVATTNRIIFEAAKGVKSTYFSGFFGESYSAQNMADMECEMLKMDKDTHLDIHQLITLLASKGVASTVEYNKLEDKVCYEESGWFQKGKPISTAVRNTLGLRKLSCFNFREFQENEIVVSEDEIKKPPVGSLLHFLKTEGAAVGVIDVYEDYLEMNRVEVYEPKLPIRKGDSHAVMIVGFCLAKRPSSDEMVPCYEFQNNWGPGHRTGRMPVTAFKEVVAPIFEDGPNDYLGALRMGANPKLKLVKV